MLTDGQLILNSLRDPPDEAQNILKALLTTISVEIQQKLLCDCLLYSRKMKQWWLPCSGMARDQCACTLGQKNRDHDMKEPGALHKNPIKMRKKTVFPPFLSGLPHGLVRCTATSRQCSVGKLTDRCAMGAPWIQRSIWLCAKYSWTLPLEVMGLGYVPDRRL